MPVRVPLEGAEMTVNVNGSPSGSLPVRVRARAWSSGVVTKSSETVGAEFTEVTEIETTAGAESSFPSLTLNEIWSGPW